jgi:SAM-dependent methyltransferase
MGLGCGDPVTLATPNPGQAVLDLGSGAGFDCFRAAELVGKRGGVIGVDMTPEMIETARSNLVKLGLENVEFLLGEAEALPVPDRPLPEAILAQLPDGGAALGRIAEEAHYLDAMASAGFQNILMERTYPAEGPSREELGWAEKDGQQARVMVRIGETGETVGEMEVGAEMGLSELPRSFSGSITARKPAISPGGLQ